tara:strand:+ start:174 stop:1331 length:1158 start_codon:yes stop_codon:yes gene_type:complete
MGFKIKNYGRAHIIGAALPNHADTYTVIKHEDVINLCINELEQAGFNIIGETYRATSLGDIATGVYKVSYGNDPDLGIMLAWTNSYNKQVAFNCTSGAYVVNSGNLMIGNYGTLNKFRRKHTGTADEDTENSIKDQITHAKMHFASLAEDKKKMEAIKMSRTEQAELLGILFAKEDLLTPRQATIVKKLMNKPNFFYSGGSDSLWTFYNYVSEALQDTHPIRWLIDQRFFHEFIRGFKDLDNIETEVSDDKLTQVFFNGENPLAQINDLTGCPPVDPNQVDLEDSIAEVEAEAKATEDELEEGFDNTTIDDPDDLIEKQIAEDEAAIAEVCDEPEEETPSEMNDIDVTKLKLDPTAFRANVALNDDFDFEDEEEEEESAEADFDF